MYLVYNKTNKINKIDTYALYLKKNDKKDPNKCMVNQRLLTLSCTLYKLL